MSTILARQLENFNFHRGFDSHGAATLLHDSKHAAQFTAEDAFEIGLEGFETLCEMDRRFLPFRSSLFRGVPKEREQLMVEEIDDLEQPISSFLKLLTDYFTFPAATKALEHLVRNYRIHVHYVNDCMSCCLLYHSTVEFQNFIRIMDLKETIWYWLEDLQKSRLPLTRDILVKRCMTDQAVLNFVCTMAKWSSEEQFRNERVFPFFAVMICEVLDQVSQVSEELMRLLMSIIASGLASTCPIDFSKATYMIIVQLCTKASMSEKAITALLQSLVSSNTENDRTDLLTIISHIYKTQNHYTRVPEKLLKWLTQVRGLNEGLKNLMDRGLDTKKFLKILFPKLIKKVTKGDPDLDRVLSEMVTTLPLSDHITDLISVMFQTIRKKQDLEIEPIRHLAKLLDIHYPILLDEALNEVLRKGMDEKHKTAFLSLFYGSPHEMLHSSIPGFDLTLLAAADSPVPEARRTALIELKRLMDCDQEQDNFKLVEGLLIRRLQDDDFDVVSAAVECRIEMISDSEAILTPLLLEVMNRCMTQLKKTGNPELLPIALRLVDLLSSQSLFQAPQRSDKICSQLLDYLFPYCGILLPISVKIGTWFRSLLHPVVSTVTTHIDFSSFKAGKKTEADLNKALIENLFFEGQQEGFEKVLVSLLGDCGTRVACFTFLSLQHHFNDKHHEREIVSILVCLLKSIESRCIQEQVLDEEVQLTMDVSVSLLEMFLTTLKTVLESADLSTIDRTTAEFGLIQILKLAPFDKNSTCSKAAIQSFSPSSPFSHLVNFLLSPVLEHSLNLISNGLELITHYLTKEQIRQDELMNCVVPLMSYLSHDDQSIRGKALRICHHLGTVLQSSDRDLSMGLASLLKYLNEHFKSIRSDSGMIASILSGMFASHNENHHKPKKQKTGIKASVNSVNCTEIQEHFIEQMQNLDPMIHHNALLMIITSLREISEDQELLEASSEILRFYTNNREFLNDEKRVKLIQMIVGLCSPMVVLIEESSKLMNLVMSCLQLDVNSGWIGVRTSVLKLIQKKWIKSGKLIPNEIFGAVLKISHHDQDPKNRNLASSIARKWPLRILDLSCFLEMAFKEDSEKQDLCLWTLEVLLDKTDFKDSAIITSYLDQLINRTNPENEKFLQISKSVIRILQQLFQNDENCKGFEIGILIEFLKNSMDPVLTQSVLSLIQLITIKLPDHTLVYITQVLEILGQHVSSQKDEELGFQQTMEVIRVMVESWTASRQDPKEIWSSLIPSIKSLTPQKWKLVINSILQGFSDKAEGLSAGILVFLREFNMEDPIQNQNWKTLSSELCQMVDLDIQNQALALTMQSSVEISNQRVFESIPHSVLELVLGILKKSIPAGSIQFQSSQEISRSLCFHHVLLEGTREMGILTKAVTQDSSDSAKIRKAKRTLQDLDSMLKHIMDINSYLTTLIEALKDIEEESQWILVLQLIKRRLKEFLDKDSKEQRLSTDVLLICPFFLQTMKMKSDQNLNSLKLMIDIIEQLVKCSASQSTESFLELLPVVSSLTKDQDPDIRAGALSCMATFLKEMGQLTLQHLPKFMPEVLDALELSLENPQETTSPTEEIKNGLELITALIEGLGAFVSPYLERILLAVLHPKMMMKISILRDSTLEMIPKQIPARLLLPQLLPLYSSTRQSIAHLQLVKGMISTMTNSVVLQHFDALKNFFFEALDVRLSSQDLSALEGHIIDVFLTFIMKLSERQFKPVFEALMDWSLRSSQGVLARKITCFRVFTELTRKLKSLFVGYFPAFVDRVFEILSEDDKKKFKRPLTKDSYLLELYIMRCLHQGLVYDDQEIFSPEITKKMIPLAFKYIQKRKSPDHGFNLEDVKNEEISMELQFRGMEFCKSDDLSITVVAVLIQCGMQSSSLQKIINHKALKACSKGSNYGRVLCLSIVQELIIQLKEEYSILIPESIPPLIEMLEVDDSRVSKISKSILRLLNEMKDDDDDHLEQYL